MTRALVRAIPALAVAGLTVAACPVNELPIEITREGIVPLLMACKPWCATVDPVRCKDKQLAFCEWNDAASTCVIKSGLRCTTDGPAIPTNGDEVDVRLFIVDASDGRILAKSGCAPVRACRDLQDIENGDAGSIQECIAGFNGAIDAAMPDGLTFDDFESTDGILLAMALYRSGGDCSSSDLFACAGLAKPVDGEGPYDITCASCQGGLKDPPLQRNTGPCPRILRGCFLQACREALVRDGL